MFSLYGYTAFKQHLSIYLINLHEDRNRMEVLKCLGSNGWSNWVDLKASVD